MSDRGWSHSGRVHARHGERFHMEESRRGGRGVADSQAAQHCPIFEVNAAILEMCLQETRQSLLVQLSASYWGRYGRRRVDLAT